jgi:hypothetical protein
MTKAELEEILAESRAETLAARHLADRLSHICDDLMSARDEARAFARLRYWMDPPRNMEVIQAECAIHPWLKEEER